jgi:hypothetical protein
MIVTHLNVVSIFTDKFDQVNAHGEFIIAFKVEIVI